jgi:hypothetical protein
MRSVITPKTFADATQVILVNAFDLTIENVLDFFSVRSLCLCGEYRRLVFYSPQRHRELRDYTEKSHLST